MAMTSLTDNIPHQSSFAICVKSLVLDFKHVQEKNIYARMKLNPSNSLYPSFDGKDVDSEVITCTGNNDDDDNKVNLIVNLNLTSTLDDVSSKLMTDIISSNHTSIEVYLKSETTGAGSDDELLGRVNLDLKAVLNNNSGDEIVDIELPLGVTPSPSNENETSNSLEEEKKEENDTSTGSLKRNGATSSLKLQIKLGPIISDYCIKSTTVSLGGSVVRNLPKGLLNVLPSDDADGDKSGEIVKVCNDAYDYGISLCNISDVIISSSDGKLCYNIDEGSYYIQYNKTRSKFFSKADKSTLTNAIKTNKIRVKVTRTYIQPPPQTIVEPVVETHSSKISPKDKAKAKPKAAKGGKHKVEEAPAPVVVEVMKPVIEIDEAAWSCFIEVDCLKLLEGGVCVCDIDSRTDGDNGDKMSLTSSINLTTSLTLPPPKHASRKSKAASIIKQHIPSPIAIYANKGKRNVFTELKTQLDTSLTRIVEEYSSLFHLNEHGKSTSRKVNSGADKDLVVKKMFYHLNKYGGYIEIKEALKPCLQRIINEKVEDSLLFKGGAPPLNSKEGHVYVGMLFDFLVKEINDAVERLVVNSKLSSSSSSSAAATTEENVTRKLRNLKLVAESYELTHSYVKAERTHTSIIQLATVETVNTEGGYKFLFNGYCEYADFLIDMHGMSKSKSKSSSGDHIYREYLSEVRSVLKNALSVETTSLDTITMLLSIALETGDESEAQIMLSGLFELVIPAHTTFEEADDEILASINNASIIFTLASLHYKTQTQQQLQQPSPSQKLYRKSLRVSSLASLNNGSEDAQRHIITSLLITLDYLLSKNLTSLAMKCLSEIEDVEKSVKLLSVRVNVPDGCPLEIRGRICLGRAKLSSINSELDDALKFACEAEVRLKSSLYYGVALLVLSDTYVAMKNDSKAKETLIKCINSIPSPIPFKVYYNLYTILTTPSSTSTSMSTQKLLEAREIYFNAAKSYTYPIIYLGISRCSLELGYLEDAEDILQEANTIDAFDARVWGLFTVVCLRNGSNRLSEACNGLRQAIDLGLDIDDIKLVMEIGMSFFNIDQYNQAEELWKLGISLTSAVNRSRDNIEFRILLAETLEAMGNFDGCIGAYEDVIEQIKGLDSDVGDGVLKKAEQNLKRVKVWLGRD